MREVFFLFYEKANFPAAWPVMELLSRMGVTPRFVKGYDHKEQQGEIAPLVVPEVFDAGYILDDAPMADAPAMWFDADGPYESRLVHMLAETLFARSDIQSAAHNYARVEAALERFCQRQPALVVLPEDTDYIRGRLAARILKKHGIKTAVLMPHYYNMFESYPLMGERLADAYLVMHGRMKDRLVSAGVEEGRIYLTGCPALQDVMAVPLPQGAHTFLYAMQGTQYEPQILSDLLEIFSPLAHKKLLLKLHPEVQSALPATLPHNVLVVEGNAPTLLAQAHTVIAESSTMLSQGMLCGRQVVMPCYGFLPSAFYQPDLCALVRDKTELKKHILRPPAAITPLLPSQQTAAQKAANRLLELMRA